MSWWKEVDHFSPKEFACPCCGACEMKEDFVKWLDQVRSDLGSPIVIDSGFRCARHNKEVGGAPNSAHLRGIAADIRAYGSEYRYRLLRVLLKWGAIRIGVSKNFIHVDMDISLPHPAIWVY